VGESASTIAIDMIGNAVFYLRASTPNPYHSHIVPVTFLRSSGMGQKSATNFVK
jgi:hypothetical protein